MQTMNGYMRPPGTTTLFFPAPSLGGPGRVISGLGAFTAATEGQRGEYEGLQRAINDIGRVFQAWIAAQVAMGEVELGVLLTPLPVDGQIDERTAAAAQKATFVANKMADPDMDLVRQPSVAGSPSEEQTALRARELAVFLTTVAKTTPDFTATTWKKWPAIPTNLVSEPKPKGRNWGAIIFGSALGVTLIGSLIYAATRS